VCHKVENYGPETIASPERCVYERILALLAATSRENRSSQQTCDADMLSEAVRWKVAPGWRNGRQSMRTACISRHMSNPNVGFRGCCLMARARRYGTEVWSAAEALSRHYSLVMLKRRGGGSISDISLRTVGSQM
jgi:hypothetical protein